MAFSGRDVLRDALARFPPPTWKAALTFCMNSIEIESRIVKPTSIKARTCGIFFLKFFLRTHTLGLAKILSVKNNQFQCGVDIVPLLYVARSHLQTVSGCGGVT